MPVSAEVALIIAVSVLTIATLIFLLLRKARAGGSDVQVEEFVFSSPHETDRQKFIYEVAGLIKAATGHEARSAGVAKYKHLDIEVYKGMRCVGVVSVVPPHQLDSTDDRIRAIAKVRADKDIRTAYVVSGGRFSDASRRLAQKAEVVLLDGASLKRIRTKAARGSYASKPKAVRQPSAMEAQRWQRPKSTEIPVYPAASLDLQQTQERKNPKAPWVEYR